MDQEINVFIENVKQGDFPDIDVKSHEKKYGPINKWKDDESKLFFGTSKTLNLNHLFAPKGPVKDEDKIQCTYEGPSRLAEDPRFK